MESLDEWIRWVVAGLVGAFAWLLKLIGSKAEKSELTAVLERMEKRDVEAREQRQRLYDKVDTISSEITQTRISMANLEGRVGKPISGG